ncbi:DNA-binding protein [Haloferax sp. Atlit-4N]|uniref:helix-turn-helix transcriptional regulator n=1 Tax=Haloferax sp. Atlit-4N TaxID=2077206 RepID=UPI000E27D0E4|nr:helix-turn-helix transcriptional regulator [Haloferax sp. Atlit-4N]RDZ52852.1 DNA-binding protein [Haloferax sp. Atlit-4N]
MSAADDPTCTLLSFLRADVGSGEWKIYYAKHIARQTSLTSSEVGYWLGRLAGNDSRVGKVDSSEFEVSRWKPNSNQSQWRVERVGRPKLVADGGFSWDQISAFQQRVVKAIMRFEARFGRSPKGIEIKEALERMEDVEEVGHGRLYPNLDELDAYGLVLKSAWDRRTNTYEVTDRGYELVEQEAVDLAGLSGLEVGHSSVAVSGGEEA